MRHPKKYYSRSFIPKHGFIANQQNDQLQVGLLAQFVEHCTDITEVMVQLPHKPIFLWGIVLTTAYVVLITAKITLIFVC